MFFDSSVSNPELRKRFTCLFSSNTGAGGMFRFGAEAEAETDASPDVQDKPASKATATVTG